MSRLKTRLDKLTIPVSQLPEVIIYKIGEDIKPRLEQISGVVILLPDNGRDANIGDQR